MTSDGMNPNADPTAFLHPDNAMSAPKDIAPELLDDASFELISCPTCGQNLQQLPGKKQIEHYRRCVVAAFNQSSQDIAPFLASTVDSASGPAAAPSFSSVGEWLRHLDLQQYVSLFAQCLFVTSCAGTSVCFCQPASRCTASTRSLRRSLLPSAFLPSVPAGACLAP